MNSRKKKIFLGIFISVLIIGLGISGIFLYRIIRQHQLANLPTPVLDFPVANTDVIDIIWGYGDHEGNFHNGIDFGNNDTMTIIAWCELEVGDIQVWYNEIGGHWQVNLNLIFNARVRFGVNFESWALNETYANIQLDSLNINEGDIIQRGEVIGDLLVHGSGSHIHFGMYDESLEEEKSVCPYQYFSEAAKVTFHSIWDVNGYGDDFWYE